MHMLDDDGAAVEKLTDGSTYIYATIRRFGQIVKSMFSGSVALDDGAMWNLIKWFTDGLCPICGNDINQSETVCDDCFEQAKQYREAYGK